MTIYDISYCQPAGTVAKLANAKADGVIIRNGYMNKTDDNFTMHMSAAIKSFSTKMIGSYTYIMADNTDQAGVEAINTIRRLRPYKDNINMPIYLDMEHKKYCDPYKVEENTALLLLECDYIQKAGYIPGIYTNQSFISCYILLDTIRNKFPRLSLWLADYRSNPFNPSMPVDIWQTGTHMVNTLKVDINKCFVDFRSRNKFFK